MREAAWRVALVIYVVTVTVTTVLISTLYDLPLVYLVAQPIVIVLGWFGMWAWFNRRWWLAFGCLLLTTAAPWGYLYLGPLAALVFSAVALVRALRSRGDSIEKNGSVAAA